MHIHSMLFNGQDVQYTLLLFFLTVLKLLLVHVISLGAKKPGPVSDLWHLLVYYYIRYYFNNVIYLNVNISLQIL